ncbi:hypothetical protein ABTC26_19000, partial [Acinetobacter baumannii]
SKEYSVALSAFQSAGSSDKINANDVTTVMFAIESGTGRTASVNASLQSVSFSKVDANYQASLAVKDLKLYPNPVHGSNVTCTFMSDKEVV